MALTDAEIRALEISPRRVQLADGNGLSLDVLPSGEKTWLYRYRLNRAYGRVTLGATRT
jgi:Arm DNA-binding domain